ncbi:MAG TPA: ribosome small subunit-dependent GTPase A [Deltaproteobacteria bacterium]|jgi:ribosome biogenesis GTPase|nr:ribosome small subunit-dependent GTPase A [Deltaproteobacteria bacterium]
MKLSDLGFDQWFEEHAALPLGEDGGLARVSAVDRGSYLIRNESGEVPAELTGRLSYQIDNPLDLPCVGDWVAAQLYDQGTAAVIHGVLPRRTFLRRRAAGANVDFQMIAANVDTAFVVQSCHFDFNPRRLDRYLVMAADGDVEPVVVLTKTDLISQAELEEKLAAVASAAQARVLALSSVTGSGFDELRQTLRPGRTYCLLGSSGVGKTTLINRLVGREAFDTKPVSGTGEGTHTTSRRQLIVLDQGAMLIDTPGMRELGLVGAGDGIEAGFEDLFGLSAKCRYADCSHEHEPGCAVRAAVERGELSRDRYMSYLKLKKESDFYRMTYLDKRKKDRAFGRLVKSVKKHMKD